MVSEELYQVDVSTGVVSVGNTFAEKVDDIFDGCLSLLYPRHKDEMKGGVERYHTGITEVAMWVSKDWKNNAKLESKIYLDTVHWELDCRYVQGYWIRMDVDGIYDFIKNYPFLKIFMTGCHLCYKNPVYARPEDIRDVVDKAIYVFRNVTAAPYPSTGRNPVKNVVLPTNTVRANRGEISLTVDNIDDTDPVIRKELKRVADYVENNFMKYKCFDLYCNGLKTILI